LELVFFLAVAAFLDDVIFFEEPARLLAEALAMV